MKNTLVPPFIDQLKDRFKSESRLIQVILGPRQVGKTTSILNFIEESHSKHSHYVSSDKVFNAGEDWLVEQWVYAATHNKILFIDEIQKSTNWAEVIKKLYDESLRKKQKIRCVLLGSSSLEIQKGLTESLTGRFQLIQAYHWNYSESKYSYNLNFENYLKFGGYPGSYQFIKTRDWYDYVLNSIVSTVIEKDILQYQTVKNPSLFKQAFEILMSYPAREISYTKLLGQLQDKGNVELVKYYIKLYEGAYLLKALEKYSSKVMLSKGSSPKILPMAPCFYQLGIKDEYTQIEKGFVFEAVVGHQLIRTGLPLYYWREGVAEVDFILKNGRKVYAIEVKSGSKKISKGLAIFKAKYPNSLAIIIDQDNYAEFENNPLEYLQTNAK